VKKIDVFMGFNLLLVAVLAAGRYYARFIQYRGIEHIEEFFFYSLVIFGWILLLWKVFRRYDFDAAVLGLVQAGILMHFAGAFVQIDGGRLYDAHLLGIRYDKFVHFGNAFAASFLVSRLFRIQGIQPTRINALFLVLVVLGLGAIVELVEYVALQTIPSALVGNYDNNMQDLVANLCGSLAFSLKNIASSQLPVRASSQ
jgi:hypothetical protein